MRNFRGRGGEDVRYDEKLKVALREEGKGGKHRPKILHLHSTSKGAELTSGEDGSRNKGGESSDSPSYARPPLKGKNE